MKVLIAAAGTGENIKEGISDLEHLFEEEGVEALLCEINGTLSGCTGCGKCWKRKRCVFEDEVNTAVDEMKSINGMIVLSEVFYGYAPRAMNDFLTRLTHCAAEEMADLPAAYIGFPKKDGCAQADAKINEYFTDANMIVLTHKSTPASGIEAHAKLTADTAKRMIWLMRSIEEAEKSGCEKPSDTYERKLDYVR